MRRCLVLIALCAGATAMHAQPPQPAQPNQPRVRPAAVISLEVQADGHVIFRLRAPQAKEVALRGEWAAAGGIDVRLPLL